MSVEKYLLIMFGRCIVVELAKSQYFASLRDSLLTPGKWGESVRIQTAVILTAPQSLFGLREGN